MTIPRFNPSDPRIPEQVQPFRIAPPKDTFAIFSSSSGMAIAAGAMFTRIPLLAFVSFLVSTLALLNAPSVQDPNSSSSPWTSMIMSISAIINVEMQKLMDPMPSRVIAPAASSTIT